LSLDAEIEGLKSNQFDKLLSHYSSFSASKSQIIYKEGSTYTLSDFLPPAMQALSKGLHFHTQYHNYSLPDIARNGGATLASTRAQLTCNCWGSAYDIILAGQSRKDALTISLSDPIVAWAALHDDKTSLSLKSSEKTPDILKNSTIRNLGVQNGDYILIYHQNSGEGVYLDHIVVVIDDDLFFERVSARHISVIVLIT
jgi:hypothetical protein